MADKYWWEEDDRQANAPKDTAKDKGSYWWEGGSVSSTVGSNITSRVNSWLQNHNSYISDYQNRYSGRKYTYEDAYVGDAADWLRKVGQQKSSFDKEADSILAYMDQHSSYLDAEWMDQVKSILTDARSQQSSIFDAAYKDNEWWGSFQDEEAYKTYQQEAKTQQQDYDWRQKYAGTSYSDIRGMLDTMEDGEEKTWMESYAPTAMTAQDYEGEIGSNSTRIQALEKVLNNAKGIRDTMGMGGEESDAIARERLAAVLEGTGCSSITELENEIEALKAQNWQYGKTVQYGFLDSNADFAEKSAVATDKRTSGFGMSIGNLWIGKGDPVYDYINDLENYRTNTQALAEQSSDTSDPYHRYSLMTQKEIASYNYLYNTQGKAAAEGYLDYLGYELNQREKGAIQESAAELADKLPVTASSMSVLANLASGIGAVDILGQNIVKNVAEGVTGNYYKPIDYGTPATNLNTTATTIRGTVAQNIADSTGVIRFDEQEHPVLSKLLNGKSLADVYQLGMSMADSTAGALLSPVLGSAGTALLGGSAATQGMLDAAANGATDEQALMMGILNGGFEMLFEKYELEHLLGADTNMLKALANQALTEGLGEGFTTVANNLADILVMAENSDWQANIQAYMEQGLSQEEATKQALLDAAVQFGWDVVGGMAMGGIMGSAGSVINNVSHNAEAKRIYGADPGALVAEALEINPDNTYAQKMQGRLDSGKTLSGGQLNKLVKQKEKAMTAQDMSSIQSAAVQRLTELGETGDVDTIAAALAKQAAGEKLSRAEQRAISGSQYGNRVANELNTENIQSGDYSSQWAEGIGTKRINAQEYSRMLEAAQQPQETTETAGDQVAAQQPETAQGGTVETAVPAAASYQQVTGDAWGPEISADGVTRQVSTGKAIKPQKIVSITDGKAMIQTDSGSMSEDDIEFDSAQTDLLWRSAVRFNGITPSGANGIIHAYRTGDSVTTYLQGAAQEFQNGYYNLESGGEYADKLTPMQRTIIYDLGQKAASEHVAKAQSVAKKAAATDAPQAETTGKVHFDRSGRTFDGTREVSLKTMEQLSAALGVDFYVYESYVNEAGQRVYLDENDNEALAPNGFYDPKYGSIHIDLNAGQDGTGTMLFTIAHELTHFIRQWSPAKFKVLANFLVKQYGGKGVSVSELVDAQIAKAKRSGREIPYDTAYEEVVADSMEAMLTDGNVVLIMAELKRQDKTLWQKICDWFKDLVGDLRAIVDTYRGKSPDSIEGKLVAQMQDVIVTLESLYADALTDAGENYQAAKAQKNTTREGGVDRNTAVRRSERIVDQIRSSLTKIMTLNTVYKIDSSNATSYSGNLKNDENSGKDVFKAQGGYADRSGFGRVVLGKKGAVSTIFHGNGPAKQAAFPAIKSVIEQGIEIGRDYNHNGKGFDTVTFAAPVDFFGTKAPLGVVVKVSINGRGDKSFYIHEICDAEGNYIQLEDGTPSKKEISNTGLVDSSSTAGAADNGISPKNSIRNDGENVNKKFSDRDPGNPEIGRLLEKENQKLKEDVSYLRELLKLQRKVTGGKLVRDSSVEAAARVLKKQLNASGDTAEIAGLLKDFYSYIAAGKELTWDGVKEQAQGAARWFMEHRKQERSDYAKDILSQIHGSRIYLDESQKAEAAHRFGSFNEFRKGLMGSITIANEANVSLDSFWQEMSSFYPDVFDAETASGDMPSQLADVIDRLKNSDTSMLEYEYNRAFMEQDIIRQIYDSYWNVSTLYTVADVKQREINRLKGEHVQRMNTLRTKNREQVEALKQQHREEISKVRREHRERSEKQQREITRRYQESRKRENARRKEAEAVRKNRAVVEKAAKALMDMLIHPTKDAHVPTALHKPLQEFLEAIDFSSKTQFAGKGMTIRDVAYTRALVEVRAAIAGQRSAMEGKEDGTFELDIPDSFLEEIDTHIRAINSATKGLDLTTNRVYDMTSDELADLGYILKVINKAIRDIDNLHMAGAKARVSELGQDTRREMSRRKPVKGESGGKAMWANYTPWHAFRRMGKAAQQIFKGLMQGQAKLARTIDSVIRFAEKTYTAKEAEAWEHKKHTIDLDSGKTISMTPAQIMSFYCLSKREHAMGHMMGGGIRISTIKEGTRESVQKEHYTLTEQDIAKINNLLTDRQRAVAERLQQYMQDVGGRLNNEISMARWDYMAATEEHYFPIKTDDSTRDVKDPGQEKTNLWALLNKSFTKGLTPGANNAMVVESIFDVFADHMSEVAEYNAFALPLVDAMKWFNYRERIQLDETHIKDVGVQKAIRDTLGTSAVKYFVDLMTDINSSQKAGRHENLAGQILSRSKVASVGWNLRVAVQQPTAILRAAVILDIPSLLKGTVRIGTKKLVKEMQKYSGIALWKSLGYYDLNVSRSVREQIKGDHSLMDKFNELGMWLPGKMDEITWARIWAATKAKVAKDQKLIGEELLRATAELFEEIVYQTQVADSVLTRSSMMRSKTQFMKEATSFMAEPTVSANILLSAFQDYEEGRTSWSKAKRGLMIGFFGYVLPSVVNALVTSLMDAWRDDDEYEEYWEKYQQALLGEESFFDGNLFSELNPLEKIVFVKDFLSMLKGYNVTPGYADLFQSAIDLVDNLKKFMKGSSSITEYGIIYQSLQVLGNATGFGLSNIAREVIGIWNNTIGKLYPDMIVHRYDAGTKAKIRNAYDINALTDLETMQLLIDNGIAESEDEAKADVEYWKFRRNYPDIDADDQWFDTYYKKVSKSGIDIEVYIQYRKKVDGVKGKEDRMAVIQAMPLSKSQKDALYLAEGWSQSTISDAPWH